MIQMTDGIETGQKLFYRLGRVVFSLENCSPEFNEMIGNLVPRCEKIGIEDQVVAVSREYDLNVRALFDYLLTIHVRYLWIRGCYLVTPSGKQVLIAGRPGSGKSTLAMALALKHAWKVVSEDLVFIDLDTLKVLSLALPFAVKDGTVERLLESVGMAPEPIIDGGWSPQGALSADGSYDAQFDAIFLFGRWRPRLKVRKITGSETLRAILQLSSLMKHPRALEWFSESISSSKNFEIGGGTLSERVQTLLDVCN